ncbi:MAG: hypothetical protein EZS28_010930 [Streblomastix strix]|uniref:Uncharacterized protein n=1 Tax=Streblomastix strix TaxID=222440 RepID=A0A5J4WF90_9EUKA|nr:MAG: hypothetical protein EZS28_010930 [Streblomastix strix]
MKSPTIPEVKPQFEKEIDPFQQPSFSNHFRRRLSDVKRQRCRQGEEVQYLKKLQLQTLQCVVGYWISLVKTNTWLKNQRISNYLKIN